MSELDEEFEQTVEQINAKLKEAARILREVEALADKAKLPALFYSSFLRDDMVRDNRYAEPPLDKFELEDAVADIKDKLDKINVKDIESAMQACGWQTSSSYC